METITINGVLYQKVETKFYSPKREAYLAEKARLDSKENHAEAYRQGYLKAYRDPKQEAIVKGVYTSESSGIQKEIEGYLHKVHKTLEWSYKLRVGNDVRSYNLVKGHFTGQIIPENGPIIWFKDGKRVQETL